MNQLESFVEILKQFTQGQRLVVLLILLVFTSGTFLLSKYMQRAQCRETVEENVKMQRDFAEVAKMLREERRANLSVVEREPSSFTAESAYEPDTVVAPQYVRPPRSSAPSPVTVEKTNVAKALEIAEKYENK